MTTAYQWLARIFRPGLPSLKPTIDDHLAVALGVANMEPGQ